MTSVQPIRILSVDNHPLIHDGLRSILDDFQDLQLVGEAASAAEALDQYRALRPDVVLMDLEMPVQHGVSAVSRLLAAEPASVIVLHASNAVDMRIRRALDAGAHGVLLKSNLRADAARAVRTVNSGRRFLDTETAIQLAQSLRQEDLQARELQVLSLIASGKANKQIAEELKTTEGVIKNHIMRILAKLRASDRTHAVVIGLSRGFIDLGHC